MERLTYRKKLIDYKFGKPWGKFSSNLKEDIGVSLAACRGSNPLYPRLLTRLLRVEMVR